MPTPDSWRIILTNNFHAYRYLPQETKNSLHDLIKVFLAKKIFKGCGITITEEIKVTVSAQACVLLLNMEHNFYPQLTEIIIYPCAFQRMIEKHVGYIVKQQNETRAGECWVRGPIILSWKHVLKDGVNHQDGSNVVLHEFAHHLDQEDNYLDGRPVLPSAMCYKTWSTVLEKNFVIMANLVGSNKKTLLDEYGVRKPSEFFAVLTETFFEKPVELMEAHKDLYELMKNYYGLNPIEWQGKSEEFSNEIVKK